MLRLPSRLVYVGLSTVLLATMCRYCRAQVLPVTPDGEVAPAKGAPPRGGGDRWCVKTASDEDIARVNRRLVRTTVEKLLDLRRPADMPLVGSVAKYQQKRAAPVETTVYAVEADITEFRLMPDGDYRVTIAGASGRTMILEMPNPAPQFVAPNSPFATQIRAARGGFDAKYKPAKEAQRVTAHARITGIGFFGRAYGNAVPDARANLIQLHPVLKLEWLKTASREFQRTAARTPRQNSRPPSAAGAR